MKAKILCLTMGLFLLALVVQGAEEDRFKGGSYDGWCRDTMSGYASFLFKGTIFRIR